MKSVHTHRFQLIGLASLVCGVLGMVAVWSATGFPPPGQVNLNRITLGLAAGALVPLGLSLCNVIWKDRLYQNLPLLAALAFNLLFDLAFLMVLGAATLWAMGIVSEFWQLGPILERADVLAGLGTAAALLFLHHYTSLIGLIVGKGQLGLHLLGRRRFPHVLERFVLVVELVDPPATVMDRNSPRYLGYLNDFYQDLEECARLHGAELASFTARPGFRQRGQRGNGLAPQDHRHPGRDGRIGQTPAPDRNPDQGRLLHRRGGHGPAHPARRQPHPP